MPKFITIGYGDQEGYEKTEQSVRDAAHEHDAQLRAEGALIGTAGDPVQVRNHAAQGVQTEQGPFMRCDLPIAGFSVVDAPSLEKAIEAASETPCAVAYGVVEVWPLRDSS
jgi:hypothetical protein